MPRNILLCAAVSAVINANGVYAQSEAGNFPSKPITMVVSAAPGGSNDAETRLYAAKMKEIMGQNFILDYKPGAGSTLGVNYVAKSKPDGYTLLSAGSTFAIFPAVYKDLPFDTLKDFAPISLMSQRSLLLIGSPTFPPKNAAEYISYAKANPGKINFAVTTPGGGNHLLGALLHSMTGTKVTFVYYKGGGPVMTDLMAGRVDVTLQSLIDGFQPVKAGKINAIAIVNDRRSNLLPLVGTMSEVVPGYNPTTWFGILAPAATPAAIVSKLNDGLLKSLKFPDVVAALEAAGGQPVGSNPSEFRQLIAVDTARWKKLIQDEGIKLEE